MEAEKDFFKEKQKDMLSGNKDDFQGWIRAKAL